MFVVQSQMKAERKRDSTGGSSSDDGSGSAMDGDELIFSRDQKGSGIQKKSKAQIRSEIAEAILRSSGAAARHSPTEAEKSHGPSLLSVLPPRGVTIKAPLSVPNPKRKRNGLLDIDGLHTVGMNVKSPKNSGLASPCNPNRGASKPSILNRPKSCPPINKTEDDASLAAQYMMGFADPSKPRTPGAPGFLSSAASPSGSGQFSARSASPNTLHVATALSLLCGLGGSPEQLAALSAASSNGRTSPSPLGGALLAQRMTSPQILPGPEDVQSRRPPSGSIDMTSEEDSCEISPVVVQAAAEGRVISMRVAPLIVGGHSASSAADLKTSSSCPIAATIMNFDTLASCDGVPSGVSDWASPVCVPPILPGEIKVEMVTSGSPASSAIF